MKTVKAVQYILIILMSQSVIFGGSNVGLFMLQLHDVDCCCANKVELASPIEQCCASVTDEIPGHTSDESDSSCSEQCQKCHPSFSKIVLFLEQAARSLEVLETFTLKWLFEEGPSLTHSPEAPPPKA